MEKGISIVRYQDSPNGDYFYCAAGNEPAEPVSTYLFTDCVLINGIWHGRALWHNEGDARQPLCNEDFSEFEEGGLS